MTDISIMARDLSKSQRAALLVAEPDGHLGRHFIRWWQASGRTLRALRRKELGIVVWSGIMLSSRGLAVRALLIEERDR